MDTPSDFPWAGGLNMPLEKSSNSHKLLAGLLARILILDWRQLKESIG